jgi:hypothetical protein
MTRDIGSEKWEYEAAIASGAALSESLRLNNGNLVGLILPATWTEADVTVQASRDGSTWHDVYDAEGTELTVVGTAGAWMLFPAGAFNGIEFIRFRSGTTATPVNQEAARTLIAVLRGFL